MSFAIILPIPPLPKKYTPSHEPDASSHLIPNALMHSIHTKVNSPIANPASATATNPISQEP